MKTIIKPIGATLVALIASFALFELSDIDIWVEDFFFDFVSQRWIIDRHNLVLDLIFYSGIRVIFASLLLSILIATVFFRRRILIQKNLSGLRVVLFSLISIPLLVGGLKGLTNVPCPNNIERYGGNTPYVKILEEYPKGYIQKRQARCYPAGHASGGFALMSLFFLFRTRKSRLIGCFTGFFLGWSVGLYKMMIGDHFLGHTVFTMTFAWAIVLIVASLIGDKSSRKTGPSTT